MGCQWEGWFHGHKVYAQFPTALSNLAYEWRNIFAHLGNWYEEDNIFLHNLFPNIEISRIFSKRDLTPTYACDIGQPISNNCDTKTW
jgi:hypothetical protein